MVHMLERRWHCVRNVKILSQCVTSESTYPFTPTIPTSIASATRHTRPTSLEKKLKGSHQSAIEDEEFPRDDLLSSETVFRSIGQFETLFLGLELVDGRDRSCSHLSGGISNPERTLTYRRSRRRS